MGTPFYSAPEFLGHKNIDLILHELPKVDSFSFGIIALKILGFLIYNESELVRINDRIRNGDILEELNTYFCLHSDEEEVKSKNKTIVDTCFGTAKCFSNSDMLIDAFGESEKNQQSSNLVTGLKNLLIKLLQKQPSNRTGMKKALNELNTIEKNSIWG